jgi:NitT/TauT family transport system ATP-binding protein
VPADGRACRRRSQGGLTPDGSSLRTEAVRGLGGPPGASCPIRTESEHKEYPVSNTVIDVQSVSKIYASARGPVHAIQNFSMKVEEGDFVAIVGPSGCGKTTLLWGLTGLHPFSGGNALILGEPVGKPRREVGIIFQQANLLPWRNLMQNISFPLEIMKENVEAFRGRIQELIDSVELSGFENHYPRELSGGMQQRASIVRALSFDPKILLMDEPFGALDAYTRDEMDTLLLGIWKKTRKTIAFVTHRIEEAVYLANRVYVMTPRPGTNSEIFDIDLPRPRPEGITMEDRYFKIVAEIKRKIVLDVEKQKKEGTYTSQAYSTVT